MNKAVAQTSNLDGRKLPERLRKLFWEYKFGTLRWDKDRDLIIGRVLTYGDWSSIKWL